MPLRKLGVCLLALTACRPSSAVVMDGQAAVESRCDDPAPLEGRWGYAKRGGYCEGLVEDKAGDLAAPFEPYLMQAGSRFPAVALNYRITWPAVRGPVTVAISGRSVRHKAKYRLDASVQGPYLDWPTAVYRATKPNVAVQIARTTETIGGSPRTVYLPISVTSPEDDEEPLPALPQYMVRIGSPKIPLKGMAVSFTRVTAEGTPAGAAVPVKLYKPEHSGKGYLWFTLDFTRQPPGLYRVQLSAINAVDETPVERTWLVRPEL